MKSPYLIALSLSLILASCHSAQAQLSRVFLVDTQGFSQTVTTPSSLERYEKVDFLSPQPYQKVMRTWQSKGVNEKSVLTSYYPSGQPMQYLEGQGGRALGLYKEWHENGRLKIQVSVSGGKFDLGPAAEPTWIFDGMSVAFDDEGRKQAEIPYMKGMKEGEAVFFHSNGTIAQKLPYQKDLLEGVYKSWYESGALFREARYDKDLLEGKSVAYWPEGKLQSAEIYAKDNLLEGTYFNSKGQKVAEVSAGKGMRALFAGENLEEMQTIENGQVQGWVGYFDEQGQLWHEIHIKESMKEGMETFFYPSKEGKPLPKITMQWSAGVLHGMVRTWFASGQLESERQIVQEKPHGPYIAYYPDGSLRALEEYNKGKLVDGKYFAFGNAQTVSRVIEGQGTATLFDNQGRMIKEVIYRDGEPCLYPSGHE
jgi:antitoxin component YwqK of YwqJK toxin-antitoxin module